MGGLRPGDLPSTRRGIPSDGPCVVFFAEGKGRAWKVGKNRRPTGKLWKVFQNVERTRSFSRPFSSRQKKHRPRSASRKKAHEMKEGEGSDSPVPQRLNSQEERESKEGEIASIIKLSRKASGFLKWDEKKKGGGRCSGEGGESAATPRKRRWLIRLKPKLLGGGNSFKKGSFTKCEGSQKRKKYPLRLTSGRKTL